MVDTTNEKSSRKWRDGIIQYENIRHSNRNQKKRKRANQTDETK